MKSRSYGEAINGALVIYEDLKIRDEVKKLPKGYSYEDLMYANMSRVRLFCLHTIKHLEGK